MIVHESMYSKTKKCALNFVVYFSITPNAPSVIQLSCYRDSHIFLLRILYCFLCSVRSPSKQLKSRELQRCLHISVHFFFLFFSARSRIFFFPMTQLKSIASRTIVRLVLCFLFSRTIRSGRNTTMFVNANYFICILTKKMFFSFGSFIVLIDR